MYRPVDLEESIQAIRELKSLGPARAKLLIRRLVDAPTTGVWKIVVAEARAEDVRNSADAEAFITAEFQARGRAEQVQAEKSAQKPQEPRTAPIPPPVIPEGAPTGSCHLDGAPESKG